MIGYFLKMDQLRNCTSLTGKVLLALPTVNNYRFGNSVIYLCGHDENGAIGIIINRRIRSLTLRELLSQMKIKTSNEKFTNEQLYFGGPVKVERGFVLHSLDKTFKGTVKVSESIGLTSTVDILNSISTDNSPKHHLIAIGIMQWQYGDLEEELRRNYWLEYDGGDVDFVFNLPNDKKWEYAMNKIGIKSVGNISSIAGHV